MGVQQTMVVVTTMRTIKATLWRLLLWALEWRPTSCLDMSLIFQRILP